MEGTGHWDEVSETADWEGLPGRGTSGDRREHSCQLGGCAVLRPVDRQVGWADGAAWGGQRVHQAQHWQQLPYWGGARTLPPKVPRMREGMPRDQWDPKWGWLPGTCQPPETHSHPSMGHLSTEAYQILSDNPPSKQHDHSSYRFHFNIWHPWSQPLGRLKGGIDYVVGWLWPYTTHAEHACLAHLHGVINLLEEKEFPKRRTKRRELSAPG